MFTLDPFDTIVGQEEDSDSDSEDSEDGLDGFSDMSSDVGDYSDKDHFLAEVPTNTSMLETVKKLDCILDLIFSHLSHTHSSSPTAIESSITSAFSLGDTDVGSDNATKAYLTPDRSGLCFSIARRSQRV